VELFLKHRVLFVSSSPPYSPRKETLSALGKQHGCRLNIISLRRFAFIAIIETGVNPQLRDVT
jgi:hypothetical protein